MCIDHRQIGKRSRVDTAGNKATAQMAAIHRQVPNTHVHMACVQKRATHYRDLDRDLVLCMW